MSSNSKVVVGVVGAMLFGLAFVFGLSCLAPFTDDDFDCFGEIIAEKHYILSGSFEDLCKAARQELLSHGGHIDRSDSNYFDGSLLDGECAHAEITIVRDERFVSRRVVEANGVLIEQETTSLPGKIGVRLTVWNTDGWHDFQFLKGKPQVH